MTSAGTPAVTGLPVFLADVRDAVPGARVTVSGEEARHAVVRRVRAGEQVALTDGEGTIVLARAEESSRDRLRVEVLEVRRLPRPSPEVTVVQAIPKGERADRSVEVLTEIGVDRIVPWAAERCVAVWRGERAEKSLARWRSTAREAAKQSRRVWFPQVTAQVSTDEVAAMLETADLAVVLHEAASEPLAGLDVAGARSVLVVVGPEGGLSPAEVDRLSSGHVVRMGETVLRTSTAGVAAVAALLSRTPRWS